MRNKKVLLSSLFILIMALLSSGCIPGVIPGAPLIESILDQIGKVGQEFIYQVIASDPDNGELSYSLTEEPEGMQIGSSTGLITWTPGESQIGAFAVEVKVSNVNSFRVKQFEITIEDASTISASLISIQASPHVMSIYAGLSFTINSITAFYDDEKSSASIALDLADYQSSNTNIATVNTIGLITGVSVGSATITVSYSEGGITKTDTINITVLEIPKVLTSISVLPSTMSIIKGNYKNITSITAYYDDETNTIIGLDSASYSPNHTNIASVSSSGKVTGVSAGTATITVAYTEGGITEIDTVGITVTEMPKVLTSIDVSPMNMQMFVGNSNTIISITAYYDNEDSAVLALADGDYSSSNTAIATVSGSGVITGVSAGSATITVAYTEGGITEIDTAGVTVLEAPKVLTSISVLPSSMTIRKGQSQTISSITAYYNNGTSANIALSSCTYQSNVTNVTVNNGVIKVSSTCAAASAIITVTYTEDGVAEKDYVTVTVPGG